MTDFVLIHGSWHGAWCWDRLKSHLEAGGDGVQALTLAGLGERVEELASDIDLHRHAEDLERQLGERGGRDATLVAHSYAGMVVATIAARLPDYGFRHIVLLDAFLPLPGENALDVAPGLREPLMGLRMDARPWALSPPDPALFGIEDPALATDVAARLTPMPLATHTQPLPQDAAWPSDVTVDYIRCLRFPAFEGMRQRVQGRQGWRWLELDAGHDAMLTHPDELLAWLRNPPQ